MKSAFKNSQDAVIEVKDCPYIYQYDGDDKVYVEFNNLVMEVEEPFNEIINEFKAQNIDLIPAIFSNPCTHGDIDTINYYLNPDHYKIIQDDNNSKVFRLENKTNPKNQFKVMKNNFSSPINLKEFGDKYNVNSIEEPIAAF